MLQDFRLNLGIVVTVVMMYVVACRTSVWIKSAMFHGMLISINTAESMEGGRDLIGPHISATENTGGPATRTAAICVVVKDEEAYLDEFAEYHRALGFHKIYVYDNSDDFELEQWGNESFRFSNAVSVIHWPGEKVQYDVLKACARRALAEGHTWMAHFDVDEHLVLKKHNNVVSFLEEHCKEGAVSIHWVLIGTGGREVYSPQPLTKRFKYRTPPGRSYWHYSNQLVKTMAVLEHVDMNARFGRKSPHYPPLKSGYKRVLPWGETVTRAQITEEQLRKSLLYDLADALLYHPSFRSYKEYMQKRLYRGRATVRSTDPKHTWFIEHAKKKDAPRGTTFDDTAWRSIRKILPKYRYYDELFPDQLQPLPTLLATDNVGAIAGRTAALCVPVKDEEAYLDEFAEYYSALGFNNLYIYDNSESFELEQWGMEKMRLGYPLNVTHWPGESVQNDVRDHCAKRALAEGHTWVASFDADEFLILKKHDNVLLFLEEYCKAGAVSIHSVLMGTGRRKVYSPQPVTKRFKYRTEEYPSAGLKSIAVLEHMDMTRKPCANYPYLKKGYKRVTTAGQICTGATRQVDPNGSEVDRNVDVALLYHYKYKSYKEYLHKLLWRDGTVVNFTNMKEKRLIAAAKARNVPEGTRFDDTAWRAVRNHLPSYGYYDELFPDSDPVQTDP